MPFASLGLSDPILKAIAEQGYDKPSPIQLEAIPIILNGKDIMAAAQTGTGKTAGFTLPLLEKLSQNRKRREPKYIKALILTPTRELAAQINNSVRCYSQYLSINSSVVFGGVKASGQINRLNQGVDILVATPGRLLDLYQQGAVKFQHLETLVLDEADRMLDMGFIHDIRQIIAGLPKKRQTLMFSATFSNEIRTLAKGMLYFPVEISVTPRNATANTVKQWICPVDKKRKSALLLHLITEQQWQQVLVFSRTKHGANRLAKYLDERGVNAAAIHGNKSQGARTRALANFKSGEVRVLVATDIAARGLDIEQLPQVVNVDLPNVAEDYVHRIGRTGRAGAKGQAVSLVSADEFKQLYDIEKLIKQTLERKLIDGFEPDHDVPASGSKPIPEKKPANNQQPKRKSPQARANKPKSNQNTPQKRRYYGKPKQGNQAKRGSSNQNRRSSNKSFKRK